MKLITKLLCGAIILLGLTSEHATSQEGKHIYEHRCLGNFAEGAANFCGTMDAGQLSCEARQVGVGSTVVVSLENLFRCMRKCEQSGCQDYRRVTLGAYRPNFFQEAMLTPQATDSQSFEAKTRDTTFSCYGSRASEYRGNDLIVASSLECWAH